MKMTESSIGMRMLRAAIVWVVFFVVADLAPASLLAQSFESVPGKYEEGACAVFAGNLQKKLTQEGKESYMLLYTWKRFGQSGNHAFVVFRNKAGAYLATDNRRQEPMVMTGSTPEEWVRQFSQTKRASLIACNSMEGGAVPVAAK
jgi:hypothetical protein